MIKYFIFNILLFLTSLPCYASPQLQGRLEHCRFPSRFLRNSRDVWVYLPDAYKAQAKPYPLLIVFDGQAYVSELIPMPEILDHMIAQGEIPKVVAVFISSIDQPSRNRELPCHPPFVDFLAQEILPWIHRNYNVTADPKETVLAGSSFGGLAAAHAAWKRPDLFGNVLSQSGAYWWKPHMTARDEWLIEQYNASPALPVRFYLDAGSEEDDPYTHDDHSILTVNRRLRDLLKSKGYQVYHREFNGGHEYECWRDAIPEGLKQTLKR